VLIVLGGWLEQGMAVVAGDPGQLHVTQVFWFSVCVKNEEVSKERAHDVVNGQNIGSAVSKEIVGFVGEVWTLDEGCVGGRFCAKIHPPHLAKGTDKEGAFTEKEGCGEDSADGDPYGGRRKRRKIAKKPLAISGSSGDGKGAMAIVGKRRGAGPIFVSEGRYLQREGGRGVEGGQRDGLQKDIVVAKGILVAVPSAFD